MANNTAEDDKDGDHSVWHDIKNVGIKMLPYIAVATVGASALGVAAMLKEKRAEKPLLDNVLSRYGAVATNIGEASCLQLVIRYACISPDWHVQYLEQADQLTNIYGNFHSLIDHCETNLMEVSKACQVQEDARSSVTNDQLEDWRMRAYQSKYLAATWLQDAMVLRHSIASLSAQLLQLIRAWNIYWTAVGNIFLTPIVIGENTLKNAQAAQLMDIKQRLVSTLRKSGLDSVLKLDAASISGGDNVKDASQASQLYDLGTGNTVVTTHVGWWVRMHTTFLPQMTHIAQKMGWSSEGAEFEKDMNRVAAVASNHPHGKQTRTKIKEVKSIASAQSGVLEQLKVWRSRLKNDGVLNVVQDPWKGFQPSPWEETFIPTCFVSIKSVNDALVELQKKMDHNMQFMFECASYVDKTFSQVLVLSGKIGMDNPALWTPEQMDDRFAKYAQIAKEATLRTKILESIWSRMSA